MANIITATHETGWACGPIPVKREIELRRRSGKATRDTIFFLMKCGYSNIVTTVESHFERDANGQVVIL